MLLLAGEHEIQVDKRLLGRSLRLSQVRQREIHHLALHRSAEMWGSGDARVAQLVSRPREGRSLCLLEGRDQHQMPSPRFPLILETDALKMLELDLLTLFVLQRGGFMGYVLDLDPAGLAESRGLLDESALVVDEMEVVQADSFLLSSGETQVRLNLEGMAALAGMALRDRRKDQENCERDGEDAPAGHRTLMIEEMDFHQRGSDHENSGIVVLGVGGNEKESR